MLYEILFTYDDAAKATPTSTQEYSTIAENPVFPNPVSTTLHWRNKALLHQETDLQIINALGQILWTTTAAEESLQEIPVAFLEVG